MAAPRHALQRKLLDGLRYLLREELKLNQPQASDGWLTQDALWLVSKTVSDKLRAHLLSQGMEGIPTSNTILFNVLQDHGIAQATPEGKAIWKAIVTSDSGWSQAFTFLKLSPALIWEAHERPSPFAGIVRVEQNIETESEQARDGRAAADSGAMEASVSPMTPRVTPTTESTVESIDALLGLLDVTDARGPDAAETTTPPTSAANTETTGGVAGPDSMTPDDTMLTADQISGEHFMDWLKRGIQGRKLIINDAKALVHIVADTVYLVSPAIFQRHVQEHPRLALLAKQDKVADWQWMQKRFEKLRLHRKRDDGLNLWTCEVIGPRKSRRLHGYLLEDPQRLFDDMPPNNPYLSVVQR